MDNLKAANALEEGLVDFVSASSYLGEFEELS